MRDLTDSELREGLTACLGVSRWVEEVVAEAPFHSFERLRQVAYDAATPLSIDEIDEALAHHPRIGEKPVGEGAAQAFSRSEQSSLDDHDDDDDPDERAAAERIDAAIAAGNVAYEERFGRVFLIRAAGRTRAEILSELERRLELPGSTELEIVGEQLRDIAMLRLEKLYAEEEQ